MLFSSKVYSTERFNSITLKFLFPNKVVNMIPTLFDTKDVFYSNIFTMLHKKPNF